MIFRPKTLDYELSPYTGLNRQSWIEAGEYLLNGIFQNIRKFDDPVVMPRKETEVTYPHSADNIREQKAEYFEGLARSFFIAAPLIHEKPDLTVCGYCLKEYYKRQVLHICAREGVYSAGHYEDMKKLNKSLYPTFQQTVETAALVICLWLCRDEIWDTYTKEEKDCIAEFLMGYAMGNTVPQNWRLFNMLDMAFLHMEGYPIDHNIMREHTQAILHYYAGDGWYRDGQNFDYYSCWAFNVYAPIWNRWYGYENMPYAAKKFEEYSNRLMETYADFFDRDGFTNMWGRSNIYRNASTSAFDGNMLLKNWKADPGLARRICSGSLLQFLTREDFLYQGVPTLGFYGQFMPLVQGYSCAESPLWLGKAFLCLHLPADHPFWTAQEHNGTWELLKKNEVKVTALSGPGLCFSNHEANGETILRTGKIVLKPHDIHSIWNYAKLCYNTKYPWESTPSVGEGVETQQYVFRDMLTGGYEYGNTLLWQEEKDEILYRKQFFEYRLDIETHWRYAMNLADFTVPCGMIRVDKMQLYRQNVELTLGAYGFPDNGTQIRYLTDGKAKAVVLKGKNFTGQEKQLAMTIYDGWDEIALVCSTGTNPDSERSIVAYAKTARQKHYGNECHILISQVITKESGEDFTEDEIFPIQAVEYTDPEKCGGYGPVTLRLKTGEKRVIDFEAMEGKIYI